MAKKTEERKHALLSASSAKKWLNCTPSARLEDAIPEEQSPYAAEGTLAHGICELKLAKRFTDKNMTDKAYRSRMGKLAKDPLYAKEMDGFTDAYVDYVTGIAYGFPSAPYVAVERRVDPWGHHARMRLQVREGQSGQQRREPPADALRAGGLERVPDDIPHPEGVAPYHPAAHRQHVLLGDVRGGAPALGGGDREAPGGKGFPRTGLPMMKLPPQLSNGEVGTLLKEAQFLKSWVNKLEAYAQGEILAGRAVPGWKLVEGRSVRTIQDVDAAYEALHEAGYPEAALYRMQPLPLGELEKLLEKEHKKILEKFIVKPPGKPTLVPDDDKRPAVSPASIAEGAFGGENAYKEGK